MKLFRNLTILEFAETGSSYKLMESDVKTMKTAPFESWNLQLLNAPFIVFCTAL
jgi:hypothetical protein